MLKRRRQDFVNVFKLTLCKYNPLFSSKRFSTARLVVVCLFCKFLLYQKQTNLKWYKQDEGKSRCIFSIYLLDVYLCKNHESVRVRFSVTKCYMQIHGLILVMPWSRNIYASKLNVSIKFVRGTNVH